MVEIACVNPLDTFLIMRYGFFPMVSTDQDTLIWQDKAWADHTVDRYRSNWCAFEAWAAGQMEEPLPATPQLVLRYLTERATAGDRYSTLAIRAAAIRWVHRRAGHSNPGRDAKVRDLLTAVRKSQSGSPPHQVTGLTEECFDRIRESLPDTHSARVTLALCGVMRDGMLRTAEAAAIRWEDIERDPDGAGTLMVRRAKNDPFGEGRAVPLSRQTMADLERIRNGSARVFPRHPRSLARRITRAAARAGLPGRFAGHSPKVGMTQDLFRQGFSLLDIQLAGGWKDPGMPAYYCRRQLARESAVARFHRRREQ